MDLLHILLIVLILAIIVMIWIIQKKSEEIACLYVLFDLQDKIVTEYREKFGDIKIDFSEKKE